jgi:hypothetical protein
MLRGGSGRTSAWQSGNRAVRIERDMFERRWWGVIESYEANEEDG